MSNKLLKGTMLLTGAAFLSKFLGMIYVIPFNELVGDKGGELYFYAYNPYTILLSISTVGVPLALSKIVSRYNSLGYYDIGFKVLRLSITLMFVTSVFAFSILYFGSEWIAGKYIYDTEHGNTREELVSVLKMISFSLLVIPFMSVIRGFFQGNQIYEPTSVSQVVEQIVRIFFVLTSAFLILKVFDGSISQAVSFATFSAFLGALASCLVLFIFWRKKKTNLYAQDHGPKKDVHISSFDLIKELLSYAGPFILVGIAIPLYQQVDSFTFNKSMALGGFSDITTVSNATINMYGHKLIAIPVTLATGMSMTLIPALTESFMKKDRINLEKQMNQSIQIVVLFVIPAVIGLSVLANVAYGSLFGLEEIELTSKLLMWYSPVALGFALFTVTAAILQGINEQRFSLISLGAGFAVKLSLNSFLIQLMAGLGSILATTLATFTAVLLNLWWIKKSIHFSYKQTAKRSLLIVILSAIMGLVVLMLKIIFGFVLPYETSRLAAIIMLAIGIVVGGSIYFYLIFKSTLLDHVLGPIEILKRFRRNKGAN